MSLTIEEIKERIAEKIVEREPLTSRQKSDQDLYELNPFQLTDWYGNSYKRVHNVTFNKPRVYAKKVIARLNSADKRTQIKAIYGTPLEPKQISEIEDLLDTVTLLADQRLYNIEMPGSRPFIVEQGVLRGGGGKRILMYNKDGRWIPDILPVDSMFTPYEVAPDGLLWAAPHFTYTKHRILDEFGVEVTGMTTVVIDYWDRDQHIVFIGDEIEIKDVNPLGYVPFVFSIVPTGSYLGGDNRIKFHGESVFEHTRELFPLFNRAGSILQTLHGENFKRAMYFESETGEKQPSQPPTEMGAITGVKAGEKFHLMPYRDLTNATRHWFGEIKTAIQEGTLPITEWGSVSFPMSAVALARLGEAKDDVLTPLLHFVSVIDQSEAMMIFRQLLDGGVAPGDNFKGESKKFNVPTFLTTDLEITYRYRSISAEQTIGAIQVAAAAKDILDDETILENIVHADHPDKVMSRRRLQRAEDTVDTVGYYAMLKEAIDMKDMEVAKLLADKLGQTLEEAQAMRQTLANKRNTKGALQLPLTDEGRGQRGVQQRSRDIAAETEMEG